MTKNLERYQCNICKNFMDDCEQLKVHEKLYHSSEIDEKAKTCGEKV